MKPFVITTDSTSDLPKEYLEHHGIRLLSLSYTIDGETYDSSHELPVKEFYSKMRAGSMPTTAQIVPEQAKELFKELAEQGYDVLHIAFSSALSGSCQSTCIAAREIMEEIPGSRVEVVDSLCASLGEGLLVCKAVKKKEAGEDLDQILYWLEENKGNLCHNFTVDDLFHLYRGGRVSRAAAVIGSVINIKPVLHVDEEGRLIPIGKVRGRKKSLKALADRMAEQAKGFENDCFFISHGDCEEDAQYVADLVKERFGIQDCLINHVGPTIGAHSGPGTVALFFMGNPR